MKLSFESLVSPKIDLRWIQQYHPLRGFAVRPTFFSQPVSFGLCRFLPLFEQKTHLPDCKGYHCTSQDKVHLLISPDTQVLGNQPVLKMGIGPFYGCPYLIAVLLAGTERL